MTTMKLKETLQMEFPELDIREKELMSLHTTFKIGGVADLFIKPTQIEELKRTLALCNQWDIPFFLLGNGSNLLVGDAGFRGVIIQIYKCFDHIEIKEDGTVQAGTGILLSTLAKAIAKKEYTGFEFAAGIPGTLGGAIYMNAGAYGGEMKDCVKAVTAVSGSGELKYYALDQLELGYRTSLFQQQKEKEIILEVEMVFEKGDPTSIYETMKDLAGRRKEKQPLEFPSAGSTFKRPEGYFAGKLIMDAGLRGFSIGGAQVSEKHCGFVVNTGGATAGDVVALINHIRRTVYEHFQVMMEPEIRILGEKGLENVKLERLS